MTVHMTMNSHGARRVTVSLAAMLASLAGQPLGVRALGAQASGTPARQPAVQRDSQPVGELALGDVVSTALVRSAAVRAARAQLDGARGAARVAASAFDVQQRAYVSGAQDQSPQLDPSGDAGSALVTRSTKYGLAYQRTFRSGVIVSPEVAMTRTAVPTTAFAPTGAASVGVGVLVPLGRGRGSGAVVASEAAAVRLVTAEELSVRQASAEGVLAAVGAYWDLAAAQLRLEARRRSEARAARLVEETEALARADERPAADVIPLRANLASKRAARGATEQQVVAARHALGLALGIPAAQIAGLPLPPASLPMPPNVAGGEPLPDTLVDGALSRRADVAAARVRRTAAELLADGTRSDATPRFDLTARAGYVGAERGAQLNRLFTPFYRNVPGLNGSLALTYELPLGNNGARGRAAQASAADLAAAIAATEAERAAASGVVVAASALATSAEEWRRASEAVALYETAVGHERQKFQLGSSTLFDVIYAEDALTTSLLGEVDARLRYARAVARLRFEAGTLVEGADGALAVNTAALRALTR